MRLTKRLVDISVKGHLREAELVKPGKRQYISFADVQHVVVKRYKME